MEKVPYNFSLARRACARLLAAPSAALPRLRRLAFAPRTPRAACVRAHRTPRARLHPSLVPLAPHARPTPTPVGARTSAPQLAPRRPRTAARLATRLRPSACVRANAEPAPTPSARRPRPCPRPPPARALARASASRYHNTNWLANSELDCHPSAARPATLGRRSSRWRLFAAVPPPSGSRLPTAPLALPPMPASAPTSPAPCAPPLGSAPLALRPSQRPRRRPPSPLRPSARVRPQRMHPSHPAAPRSSLSARSRPRAALAPLAPPPPARANASALAATCLSY
ncbi:uncharacterized protein LOC109707809 [Ananas comosus]|uniref:Uncharacterized protein LOC109707809 n=1 Tax=Ananas comosus TaxID=4615 RepID=A0A6P5EN78_ANACO|nr:uncharacterized protein LOC109707809 [Ananas comosus]